MKSILFALFIVLGLFLNCQNKANLKSNVSHSNEYIDSTTLIDNNFLNETEEYITNYKSVKEGDLTNYSIIDSLIKSFSPNQIKNISLEVNKIQIYFTDDSYQDTYQIIHKSDTIYFQKHYPNDNEEIFTASSEKGDLKSIPIFTECEISAYNSFKLETLYNESNYFSIENSNQYLLIESSPQGWTGKIMRFAFYQLVDYKNQQIYEFFRTRE